MESCADAMVTTFSLARKASQKALSHALELVNLQLEDFGGDAVEAKVSWTETIDVLEMTISQTREQFSVFRLAIQQLPRISARLNAAKRKLLSALGEFDSLLDQTISSAGAIRLRVNSTMH